MQKANDNEKETGNPYTKMKTKRTTEREARFFSVFLLGFSIPPLSGAQKRKWGVDFFFLYPRGRTYFL